MDKIKITFENPKGIIISYINIKSSKLKEGDITLELLSEEVQSIEIPYNKDIEEGEITIKIKYKPFFEIGGKDIDIDDKNRDESVNVVNDVEYAKENEDNIIIDNDDEEDDNDVEIIIA
ncbi:hypothetical protein [Methanotorris igneus]|uniref:Uncharacterized protein n=1 Tax=Methanotorris igneus (strain DSM 5666 / JCM 11834 / Kol 5) TaxID=880724 RepID=F6BDK4_METIK|nr:hypothetical protein [Methanotorris igneus]AEF96565.1 hypothetical protein Metig_1023 [Methanotorris igneus Kol 5]